MVVQELRLFTPFAGEEGSIPGQGERVQSLVRGRGFNPWSGEEGSIPGQETKTPHAAQTPAPKSNQPNKSKQ